MVDPSADPSLRRLAHVADDLVTGDKTGLMTPAEHVRPAELPREAAHFTGRHNLLDALEDLIDTGAELVAVRHSPIIHGMAGVGKTAVALHWAHSLVERGYFPDGHLYLDLRGFSTQTAISSQEALGRLLRGMGVHEKTIPRTEDEQKTLYRTLLAHRRLLILLDDVATTEQVRPLLPGRGNCLVVVTSRDKLAGLVADGLRPFQIEPFSPQEAVAYIGAMVGEQRVDAEPQAAETLAHECAYLPLALRVAVAKVADSPDERLETTATELARGDRLPLLALPDDPTQAVLPAFELSYHALSPELQRAFRLLCLVDGPDFTVEAAAALLDARESVARELIRALNRVHVVDQVEAQRYGIHDLLREFGRRREIADSPAVAAIALGKLLNYYLDRLRPAGRSLGRYRRTIDSDDPSYQRRDVALRARDSALDWLERERANLVAAVGQAFKYGYTRLTWEFADALYDFLAYRRYGQDNEEVHMQGLAAAQHAEDSRAELFMLCHLGQIYLRRGAFEEANQCAQQAHNLSQRCGDLMGLAESLTVLARILHAQGNVKVSLELAASSRMIWRRVGNEHGEAEALLTVGYMRWLDGEYGAALVSATWALDIQHRIGDRHGEADSLDLIAGAFRRMGDYAEATHHAERALRIRQESGDRYGESGTRLNLARVLRRRREFERARDLATTALHIRRDRGDGRGVGEALAAMARIHRYLNDLESAKSSAEQAFALAFETIDRLTQADALHTLAHVYLANGEGARALEMAAAALDIDSTINDPYGRARRLHAFGLILLDLNRAHEALEHFTMAMRLERQIGDALGAVHTMHTVAEVHRRLGDDSAAERISREAEALEQESWQLWDHDNGHE